MATAYYCHNCSKFLLSAEGHNCAASTAESSNDEEDAVVDWQDDDVTYKYNDFVDTINHPPHYTHADIEPIDVIESWHLNFCLGNCVKYIARSDHKGKKVEDLKKAAWYLAREIERLKDE